MVLKDLKKREREASFFSSDNCNPDRENKSSLNKSKEKCTSDNLKYV